GRRGSARQRSDMIQRNPPAWAETALRALLAPRDRDTITGDLLEEYRETPRAAFEARIWYLRQAWSLASFRGVKQWIASRAQAPSREGGDQVPWLPTFLWAAAAGLIEAAIILMMPGSSGLGVVLFFVAMAALLGVTVVGSVTAIRSVSDLRF